MNVTRRADVLPGSDAAGASRADRNLVIDGLKFAAAASIVLHHASLLAHGRFAAVVAGSAYWALWFFFAVAGYFHGETGGRGAGWLRRRLVRLAVPYGVWSCVYLLWAQRVVLTGDPPVMPSVIELLFLGGARDVLWYIPVLMLCAVVAEVCVRGVTARRAGIVIGLLVTLAVTWLVPVGEWQVWPLGRLMMSGRWLATYLAGMGVRAARQRSANQRLLAQPVYAVVAIGLGLLGILYPSANFNFAFPTAFSPWSATAFNLLGLFIALAILWTASGGAGWLGAQHLAWGGGLLLGIYVAHPLWLDVFEYFVRPVTLPAAAWIPLAWGFGLGMATLTTRVLLKARLTRASMS